MLIFMKQTKLFLSVFALMSLLACQTKKTSKEEVESFIVTNPLVTDTSFIKEYVAEIQSIQNVEIRAKVKGFIESIKVDEGQKVKAGQLLFTIRPREYEVELLKARAEVKKAEVEAQNAKVLADKNIVSKSELTMALAKLEGAKAEEQLAELYVSYTQIRAPYDGIVDRLKFKVGSLIDEGTLLTSLSNNKEVYAYFNVSELEYLDFATKQQNKKNVATLLLANGQAHQYKGSIETIEGEFDKNTGTVAFRAKFPNPTYLLKHGETGRVQLKLDLSKALIIPQKSTYELQDKTYVFVVDQNNVVQSRLITIKQKLPNIYIVDTGLMPNDKIIFEGVQSAKEDEKIETKFISAKDALGIK
jgi:membrane fusion protein (multidrug efflux system)